MTPLCGKPAVVIVQPTNHSTYIESAIDRIELEWCTKDASTIGNCGAFDDGTEKFGAFFEAESFETTAEGIKEDEACGIELESVRRSN